MINCLQPFLDRFGVVILDGGLASELERRGADLHDPLWSAKLLLENPDLIRQVHADYFLAGADVATTASYQATFAGFAGRGLDERQAAELMVRSVRLAEEARDGFWSRSVEPIAGRETMNRRQIRPLVAASVGCYGASLHDGSEYRGDYGLSRAQLEQFHRPRLEVLAGSGADMLGCETIPCRVEAEALVRVLAEFPDMPAWMSFSCRDERHVCHGETLAECVAVASTCPQIVAVGVNCTAPRFVSPLLKSLAGVTSKPLLAYPNRGESWNAATASWQEGEQSVLDWGKAAQEWYAAGARLIGGCCRTTPEDIRRVTQACRA